MSLRTPLSTSFSRAQVMERTWPFILDLGVAGSLLALFYVVLWVARSWLHSAVPEVTIYRSPSHLPMYALESTVRIFVAYILSLIFAIVYGYIAAYNRWLEALMIATLDILQSIPVLSFLPGVMLAMMSLFPNRQIGIELGAILLIFTGEVWNMAFSFYSSLKSIPKELMEACTINRFSRWQRLIQLELPFSAIGLIWNSMVSVASGWFFLMVCEMFPVGSRNFRLPGLGSYLQTAASNGDVVAIIWGLLTMMLIIVLTDQLLWRPIIAWSDKFKFENVESAERITSPILHLIRNSNMLQYVSRRAVTPISEAFYTRVARGGPTRRRLPAADETRRSSRGRTLTYALIVTAAVLGIGTLAFHAMVLLREASTHEFLVLLGAAGMTFLRVNASLLIASLWTIPVGVAIGFHPRLANIAQPIAQIAASFPATALFPLIVIGLMRLGMGLGIGSIALMLLGTQWYILFNVIAGAMAIPSDLREVAGLFRFGNLQRWTTLILPGIFPYLVTGLITASGGAWNASIVAEYFKIQGKTMQTIGLGAQISAASDHGDFPRLLLATIIMALMVVTINRLVWRRLYHLGETRFRLDA
ncbi:MULTISPECIES: ABC transporter permease subunit [Acidobacterium]|uniref:Inorganic anion ABC transporter, nitrate/nitrite/cyanate uptake transporter (NitT) family, permease protein n=1 Tax=Acidobacterium capsulatum (strain ATCC 51196 / DSM 11244 / BCRC 80197 / JCM 7670 / NBRC 15755 / NCIMB 13165 / 161) TaxID=240015 RepID=C1F0Z5_ACIC5|nr:MULTISPECIES: ABC transporter permease subunit [Acidobacterium]ACO33850.1 inorganic anion ABC transporter, nitrate/nitrite/cyanate uptake transporter (NitT) family, permease protein [Acidobacterium capsulatum ATCC 51196]HCT61967.1 ABC transporter permease [Acidobacterium sp.]